MRRRLPAAMLLPALDAAQRDRHTGPMCVNYLTPGRRELADHFGIQPPEENWKEEVWQNYAAPIIVDRGQGPEALLANYGFVPKSHLPPGVRLTTMNARAETAGQLRTYRHAWHAGQFCLVPMQAFFEPCYATGRAERWKIGLASGGPFAVAGLWRSWEEADGRTTHAFTQLTVNADYHPLMRQMHKPGDEKRSLVIIEPEQCAAWLENRDPELARSWLTLLPAASLHAEPAPRTAPSRRQTPGLFE